MPESPESTRKEEQTTPKAQTPRSHTIMSLPHTHTHTRSRGTTHTMQPARKGHRGPVMAGASRKLISLAGFVQLLLLPEGEVKGEQLHSRNR